LKPRARDRSRSIAGWAAAAVARRLRGLSWSLSEGSARWFAERARIYGLHDPAVFRVTVDARLVLTFVDSTEGGRGELEFIVRLPESVRPVGLESESIENGKA
jgi:hypothetical protein